MRAVTGLLLALTLSGCAGIATPLEVFVVDETLCQLARSDCRWIRRHEKVNREPECEAYLAAGIPQESCINKETK